MSSSKLPRAWQRMLSGRQLDLLEPSPLDIEIDDIAHGLARVARWNGQTRGSHAFSVAQHSAIVWQIFKQLHTKATPEEELVSLLHDAPEYVIGDMISPFKSVLGESYKGTEARLAEAIHLRYSLPAVPDTKLKSTIKKADSICAYFEATLLAGFDRKEATKFFGTPRGFTSDMFEFEPLSADAAQQMFLDGFELIERRRQNAT